MRIEVFGHFRQELVDILLASLGFGSVLLADHLAVATLFEYLVAEFGQIESLLSGNQPTQKRREFSQAFLCSAAQVWDLVEMAEGGIETQCVLLGEDLQAFERSVANASARSVYDSPQGDVVDRVYQQSQVGKNVFDFPTVVEANATDNYIGKSGTLQFFF